MDPFLMSLLIAWFIVRGSVDDARHAVTGKPSPRQLYRQRYGPSGAAQIGNAVAGRVADRIRNGPAAAKPAKDKPLNWRDAKRRAGWWDSVREYASDLKDEAKESAEEGRRRRREERERKAAGEAGDVPPPPDGTTATPDGEGGKDEGRRKARWWRWAWRERDSEPEEPPGPVHATAERTDRAEAETDRAALPAGSDGERDGRGEAGTADAEAERAGEAGPAPELDAEPPKPTRRLDGEPESEADSRFFDLRESGYTGPIDRDGHQVPADHPHAEILADLRGRTEQGVAGAAPGGEVLEGELVEDGRGSETLLRTFRGVEIPIPPDVGRECPQCHRTMAVEDDAYIGEFNGSASVGLRCSCGVETRQFWRAPDEQFEAVFGYRFGERREAEDTPTGAQARPTEVPGPLNPEGSLAEGEISTMSAPVAEHGLAAFQNYVAQLQGSCDEAINSLEQTIAAMVSDGFKGEAIEGLQQSKDDYFPAIRTALETVAEALRQSETVKDAYQGAMHTGHRDSVLAE